MNELLVFAKAPRLGTVKTRLAETMGAEAALKVYFRLLEELRTRLQGLPNVTVCFAPEDGQEELRAELPNHWSFQPQLGADLGERLQHAFTEAFARGAERVAAIGSDCPVLSPIDIQDAWRALDHHDVVFGPSEDGGYWLIGMRQMEPGLFNGISWSSSSVLKESLAQARDHQLRVAFLRRLRDIDTEADWRSYLAARQSA